MGQNVRVIARTTALISRRTLLVAAATGVVVVACGNDESPVSQSGTVADPPAPSAEADDGKGLALVRFFDDPSVITGDARRLVFGLALADGTLREEGPDTVDAELIDPSGSSRGSFVGTRRAKDLFRQYYQFRVDVPAEGIYTLRVSSGGDVAEAPFTVVAPGSLAFPSPGDEMPPFDTPTVADPGGVDPLCTRDPVCSFHDLTLTEALGAGQPIAYLVGTPAHCQTGVCGPMLDVMISVQNQYPTVTFLHAEVFEDNAATTVAPAVEALHLSFEPVLFLVGADGVIVDRLDVIFDATELTERLDALVA